MAEGISAGKAFLDIVPRMDKFAERLNSNVLKVAGAAATAIAIKASVSFAGWAGQVKVLTRELGVSAKTASRLAFTGRQLGLDATQLSASFGLLSKKLASNDKIFGELNITIRKTDGTLRPFEEILGELSNRFAKMPDGPQKTALALELFGRAGKSLIPLLNQGAEGLAKFAKQSDALGFTIGQDGLDKLKKYKVAQRDLTAALKGLEIQLGAKTTPVITFFTERLGDAARFANKIPAPLVAIAVGATSGVGALVTFADGLVKISEGGAVAVKFLAKLSIFRRFSAVASVADAAATAANAAAKTAETAAAAAATVATARLTGALVAETGAQGAAAVATRAHDAALASLASRGALARGALGLFTKGLGKAFLVVAAGAAVAKVTIKHFDGGIKELIGKMEDGTASAKDMGAVFDSLSKFTGRRLEDALARSALKLRDFANGVEGLQGISDATQAKIRDLLMEAANTKDLGDDARALAESWKLALADVETGTKSIVTGLDKVGTKVAQFAGMTGESFTSWRNASVDNFNFVKGSLQELSGQANLTATEILRAFEKQLRAQRDYAANFAELVRRGLPEDFRRQLADMGTQGAGLVDALANANHKTFNRIVRDWDAGGKAAMALVRVVAGLPAAIAAIPKLTTITFRARFAKLEREERKAGIGFPGLQHGGTVTRAGGVVVGERAPEILNLPRGAHVAPLGAGSVNITVQGSVITERQLREVVRDGILETKRRNGRAGLS